LLAKEVKRDPEDLYRNIRAACESGWDFSSRWFEDGKTLGSIITTHLIPVDLNCLIYNLEKTIARGYALHNQKEKNKIYLDLAEKRKKAILKYCWNQKNGFFFDYNFKTERQMPYFTLASSFPLFFQIATKDQAKAVEKVLSEKFVKPGGLVTTLAETKQQWDSPNGWPPLQLISIEGLERYKLKSSAATIKERWVKNNIRVYKNTGKLMEKYNVLDDQLIAGGGEYPLQDGFGWTNGVLLYLLSEMD
jgi:alpha,alpha-trehalase